MTNMLQNNYKLFVTWFWSQACPSHGIWRNQNPPWNPNWSRVIEASLNHTQHPWIFATLVNRLNFGCLLLWWAFTQPVRSGFIKGQTDSLEPKILQTRGVRRSEEWVKGQNIIPENMQTTTHHLETDKLCVCVCEHKHVYSLGKQSCHYILWSF